MKQRVLGICVVMLVGIFSAAPAPAAQWARVYGGTGNETGGIWPADGGGYYLFGSTDSGEIFAKLNASGGVLWTKQIGGASDDYFSVSEVTGGYLVTGETKSYGTALGLNIVWAKFDTSWRPVYQNVFGGAGDETGAFYPTSDGGLLFSGGSNSYGASPGDKDFLLIKIKSSGDVAWKKVYHYGTQDLAGNMVEVSNGYVVAGTTLNQQTHPLPRLVLMKINKTTGAPIWIRVYKHPTGMLVAPAVTPLADGGFMLQSSIMSFTGSHATLLVKTNSAGVIQWQKSYSKTSCSVVAYGLIENADHTLILNGSITDAAGTGGILVVKLSPATGSILWSKRLGKATEVNGGFISKWTSGEVVLSGYHATDPDDKHNKLLYAKLNATTYAPVWVRLFGGTNDDYGSITKQAGGYLMSGATNSFGPGIPKEYNIFGMLLDANGNYPGCHVTPFSLPVNTKPGIVAANPGLTTTILQSLTSRASGAPKNFNLKVSSKTLTSQQFCASIATLPEFLAEDEEDATADVILDGDAERPSDDE